MAGEELFDALPEQHGPQRAGGEPRLREPQRDQIELRAMDIDSLIGEDHAARLIWAYVEQVDLRELEDVIKAREGVPGQRAGAGAAVRNSPCLSLAVRRGVGEPPHAERLPRRSWRAS